MPERAYALLGQGRCLRGLGRHEAEQPLREARDLFAVDGLQAGARRDRGAARADGECAEFLGDLILLQALNTAARLTDRAGAGEILISADAAMAAGLETTGLERRTLELRGRAQALDPGSPEPPLTLDDDLAGDRQRTLQ